MIKLVSAIILIYHLSIIHTHSYWKKGNTINRYLQHIVQKYLQFINISATKKIPFERTLTGSQFVYVKFLWLGFTLSWRRPLTPWSLAKPETFHSLVLTTRAWLPPIQQPEYCVFCLKKPASGALKSQRTPGMLYLREGCEGCGG